MGQGLDWITSALKIEPSPLGGWVADLLDSVFAGIYHLDTAALRGVDWTDGYVIRINLRLSLATFDMDNLTALVFECHARALRLDMSGAGPGLLRLLFHERVRTGGRSKRHPSLGQAVVVFEPRRDERFELLRESLSPFAELQAAHLAEGATRKLEIGTG